MPRKRAPESAPARKTKALRTNYLYKLSGSWYCRANARCEQKRSDDEVRWLKVLSTLNEFQARLYVADRALDLGRGGVSQLSRLTGLSRTTITKAITELETRGPLRLPTAGIRTAGAGRKRVEEMNPRLRTHLRQILEQTTAGDPMSALRWTSKSTRTIADELGRRGHPISDKTVARCLDELGYSLQANRKTQEGRQHPDRDAQFRYINRQVRAWTRTGDPVISVDTNYDPAPIMDTDPGAAVSAPSVGGPAAAHLIRDVYT